MIDFNVADYSPPPDMQHKLSHAVASNRLAMASSRAPISVTARLASCSGTAAGSFLTAIPASNRMSPLQFNSALA
eukprot:1244824-Karenia_brevis.AAC.1